MVAEVRDVWVWGPAAGSCVMTGAACRHTRSGQGQLGKLTVVEPWLSACPPVTVGSCLGTCMAVKVGDKNQARRCNCIVGEANPKYARVNGV